MTLTSFDGSFYDADYYERGRESGKGWLTNYHWMPRRSFREAFAFIDYLGLDDNSRVLDFGCAKGFLVKALRTLEIKADGCDISQYALSFAPEGCWDCGRYGSWLNHANAYTHVLVKDVFEHLTPRQLDNTLHNISIVAPKIMCVVPMGDNGVYRIPEYHTEISHLIAENENWWTSKFMDNHWRIIKHCEHVDGLKDNWFKEHEYGNHVFVLEYI